MKIAEPKMMRCFSVNFLIYSSDPLAMAFCLTPLSFYSGNLIKFSYLNIQKKFIS